LLVVGSLNSNQADRVMESEDLRSVQLIGQDLSTRPVPAFQSWTEVNSLCWDPIDPFRFFVATPSQLFRISLVAGSVENLNVDDLDDVHEITVIDREIWIANTGRDEIAIYDLDLDRLTARVSLSPTATLATKGESKSEGEKCDTFHVNQAFRGYGGEAFALCHHHTGYQEMTRVAQRLVKRQGDGGVVDLASGHSRNLGLKAPHNVRLVAGNYWVFDSGRSEVKVFDSLWNHVETIPTLGFGRGADFEVDTFFAGISAKRKRYLGVISSGGTGPNMVQVIDIRTRKPIGSVIVPNVEQINNVYIVDSMVAEALLRFG